MKRLYFLVLFFLLCSPVIAFVRYAFLGGWHFHQNLSYYLFNSLLLMLLVGFLTAIIGTTSAIIVTFFEFPGRKIGQILLFAPIALPGYITAFTYSHNFSFGGWFQNFLSNIGINITIDVNNLIGCAVVMSISLYPYVYMFVRSHLSSIGNIMDVARTFGGSPLYNIVSVALPSAKASITSSVVLVLMESIADFGTPNFFAVDTLSTGIYRKWALANNYHASAQLTIILLSIIICVILMEITVHKYDKGASPSTNRSPPSRWNVTGLSGIILTTFVFLIPAISLLPTLIPLIYWTLEYSLNWASLALPMTNTLILASTTSMITVSIALVLVYLKDNSSLVQALLRVLTLGYAIPNSVMAIGMILFTVGLSRFINHTLLLMKIDLNIALIGTIFSLIYAYVFRFIAIPIGSIESGLTQIPKEIHWSALIIGGRNFRTFSSVEVQMIRKSVLVSLILVFTDALKELSATLIIRPFNFETLSIKIFELVSEERPKEASLMALTIFAIDLAALLILLKISFKQENLQTYCKYDS